MDNGVASQMVMRAICERFSLKLSALWPATSLLSKLSRHRYFSPYSRGRAPLRELVARLLPDMALRTAGYSLARTRAHLNTQLPSSHSTQAERPRRPIIRLSRRTPQLPEAMPAARSRFILHSDPSSGRGRKALQANLGIMLGQQTPIPLPPDIHTHVRQASMGRCQRPSRSPSKATVRFHCRLT